MPVCWLVCGDPCTGKCTGAQVLCLSVCCDSHHADRSDRAMGRLPLQCPQSVCLLHSSTALVSTHISIAIRCWHTPSYWYTVCFAIITQGCQHVWVCRDCGQSLPFSVPWCWWQPPSSATPWAPWSSCPLSVLWAPKWRCVLSQSQFLFLPTV